MGDGLTNIKEKDGKKGVSEMPPLMVCAFLWLSGGVTYLRYVVSCLLFAPTAIQLDHCHYVP